MAKTSGKKKIKIFTKKKSVPESKIIEEIQARYESIDETKIQKFSDFPLSSKTLKALTENEFIIPTDIQRQSIGLALGGNDILGAAKTGSGKTLAFLIPILERLYCMQWTKLDGIGAVVITPTRELAYQIYETLRKVGKYHDISAGLIIGGKDLNFEKKRLDQCNIIIGTPGRILQHMDENPLFDCVTMKILVLDEADRCLDMGFEASMNAIIENLPLERQTLLFSATQTKSLKDLARLSLKDPMYVSVHEHAKHVTPEGLQQSYVICNLEDKMAMLWSFIKHHLKQKIIVFFSSCKQVKYVYEAFCRMRPGMTLLALYGTLHQLRRMEIYENFCKKQSAVLFATDIASRGLDFPDIHWVVQMDCPEDTNAYIHRAGRTARFKRGGEALLVLLPSEEKMVDRLIEKKIPINKISINPNKLHSPHRKLEALLARDVNLKDSAQRAFIAYVKSVFLMKDKEIFDVHALDTDSYARSLGLAIPPRIRFLQRMQKKTEKNQNVSKKSSKLSEKMDLTQKILETRKTNDESSDEESEENGEKSDEEDDEGHDDDDNDDDDGDDNDDDDDDDDDNDDDDDDDDDESNDSKEDNLLPKKGNKNILNSAIFLNDDNSDDDDILTIKRKNVQIEDEYSEKPIEHVKVENNSKNKKAITKAAVAKKLLRKKIKPNKKTTFDDEGKELLDPTKSKLSEMGKKYENADSSGINIDEAKEILREEDRFDKQRFRAKIKEKHKEERRKLKGKKKKVNSDEEEVAEEYELGQMEMENGSGSESDGPDLSWLPDPDKIYGPKKGSSDDESNKSDQEESDNEYDEKIHRPPKRKLLTHDKYRKKKQKIKISKDTDLVAAEELALQLLKN